MIHSLDVSLDTTSIVQVSITNTPGFSNFQSSGIFVLDGVIAPNLLNGFIPSMGQVFDVINAAGGVIGAFDNSSFVSNTGGLLVEWDVLYGPNKVSLEAVTAGGTPGDYDGNGFVDGADYQRWRADFGSKSDLAADGNGNGVVDAADYTVWRDHLGTGSVSSGSLAVPEPSTGIVMIAAIVGLFASRRHSPRQFTGFRGTYDVTSPPHASNSQERHRQAVDR